MADFPVVGSIVRARHLSPSSRPWKLRARSTLRNLRPREGDLVNRLLEPKFNIRAAQRCIDVRPVVPRAALGSIQPILTAGVVPDKTKRICEQSADPTRVRERYAAGPFIGEDMIDVSELRTLIKHEQQPLTDIEQIFRALVGYPNAEEIANSTRADRVGALDAACESLIGDNDLLPPETLQLFAEHLSGEQLPGTYEFAVAVILNDPGPWHRRLDSFTEPARIPG